MLKTYFSDWGYGKLQRLPYLGYYVLLMVLMMAILFGGIMLVGATENIIGGNLEATQQMLTVKFGIVSLIAFSSLIFIMILAQVNILGKRIRDMGLPVLWTILGIVLISMVLNVIFPPHEIAMAATSVQTANSSSTTIAASATSTNMIVQGFDMFVALCLLFIPSNTFSSKNNY